MKILVVLIIVSLSVAVVFLVLFIWSVKSGQYDDTDSPAVRILYNDKKPPSKNNSPSKSG